ncbi:MAG: peptidase [Myxococcales bacterium]
MVALLLCAGADAKTLARRGEPVTPRTERTDLLRQYAETWRFRNGQPAAPVVTPEGTVLFLRSGPRSFTRSLWELDPATGERELLTAEGLLGGAEGELSAEEKARRERMRLAERGITSFSLSEDGRVLLVPLSGRLFNVDRAGKGREMKAAEGGIAPRLSPDGSHVAFTRAGDLWVAPLDGEARRLTTDGGGEITNGLAEFVAQEEMGRMDGTWWSPDSTRLLFQRTDTARVGRIHIADPSHPEKAPDVWPYPRAGEDNADVTLGIVAASGGETTWVAWDRARYPYLAAVHWGAGAPLLVVQTRSQQELALLEVGEDGATRTLKVETDPAWVELDRSVPRRVPGGILWSSERSGARTLELLAPDGARTLGGPEVGYRSVEVVGDGAVLVHGGPEPSETHVWRVPLDGSAPTRLTTAPGEHQALGGDRRSGRWVHGAETLDAPPAFTLMEGERALAPLRSVAEEPVVTPRVELMRVGDRELRAAVVRPTALAAGQPTPVILYVYGGPHARLATAARGRYVLPQWFAEQGFIVVSIDGRGTPWRGRDWERAIRGDLAGPALEDQVAGLRAVAARVPEMDLSRVGVFGWSFGGTMAALAVLREPGLFKAAVAGAPVTDWRHYDTHYTERYLGLPTEDAAAYDRSSPLSEATRLQRPLLLIHGTADDNVLLVHSLVLSRALFDAGISHGFLPLAGETHMVAKPDATVRVWSAVVEWLRAGVEAADRPER